MENRISELLVQGKLLIPRKKAANMLGVAPGTLAVWACNNRTNLPVVKVGSRCFYRLTDIEAWIEDHTK